MAFPEPLSLSLEQQPDQPGSDLISTSLPHARGGVSSSLSAAEYTTAGTISNCAKMVEGSTIFGSTSGNPANQTISGGSGNVGFRAFKVVREVFDGEKAFSITIQRYGTDNTSYDVNMRWGESR